ncbi:MAG TPA: glycine cleavage system protein H [Verrucomicrobiae bacterium]
MPEYLETTADKFTFRVATDRMYTPQGVWVKPDPATKRVRLGLADYPQQHNGDVAFANVKPVGTQVIAGALVAEIETIKAMVEVASPISGKVIEVNAALTATAEAINQSPYEAGWLAIMEPSAWEAEHSTLLDAPRYFAVMQAQAQEDLKYS